MTSRRTVTVLVGAFLVSTLLIMALPSAAELAAGSMDVKGNEGGEGCRKTAQRYNEVPFILRENPCATYEAPFMYLLVGSTRALLIDSGDVSDPQAMPLARTVHSLLPAANFPLLVVHTHGHRDHRMGDGQFAGTAGAEVIGTSLQEVTRGLHL